MSDHAAAADIPPQPPENPFDDAEIRGFADDDIVAGQAITKMLSTLFIYTLIAMSIVSLWTVAVSN